MAAIITSKKIDECDVVLEMNVEKLYH
uniref:Uncharacterized protein n=1 Tax=Arundo donax TaxID=35708 RepID=A0A0A9FXR8_ARUDO